MVLWFKDKPGPVSIAAATKPYKDFINDLAEVYPAIVYKPTMADYEYTIRFGAPHFLEGFRTKDLKTAAEAVRTSENQKKADALVAELRKTRLVADEAELAKKVTSAIRTAKRTGAAA